jgi:hypothetical protein
VRNPNEATWKLIASADEINGMMTFGKSEHILFDCRLLKWPVIRQSISGSHRLIYPPKREFGTLRIVSIYSQFHNKLLGSLSHGRQSE